MLPWSTRGSSGRVAEARIVRRSNRGTAQVWTPAFAAFFLSIGWMTTLARVLTIAAMATHAALWYAMLFIQTGDARYRR